ncbi:PREDICTED: LOW QUALITY PROTEIN: olfactory receptor 8S1-like [Bison bison bison]|uniref:LOW QUALITY PROTEIN: olfactory receptor 8S1-like n=1 Tax=Bison bison bison TaxID=43346 RepID=A0A6P3GWY5_BISBB|nr:PREDICTED: LOW QUALITY PROTEIN: olfactory receptor 8S1-like [Bison bison bison]
MAGVVIFFLSKFLFLLRAISFSIVLYPGIPPSDPGQLTLLFPTKLSEPPTEKCDPGSQKDESNLGDLMIAPPHTHVLLPGHLSFLDIGFSSVTVPKMLQNFLSQKKSISVWGCITQSFFFLLYGCAEASLLSAMAYDRYAAVCHPLLYTVVMNRPLCTAMVCAGWLVGLLNSLVNHLFIHKLRFWGSNTISHFFCELPSLFPLSCTDPTANEFLLSGTSALLGLLTLPLILFSYSRIISAILNIHSYEGQGKAFSTCSSHLTVVLLFYGKALFRYISPASGSVLERVVSIQYSVITSLLNPLIYSLKNQEVKGALQRMLRK